VGDWAIFDGTVWRKLAGGGAADLDALSDVVLTSVAGNDQLVYDAATSKWINVKQLTVGIAAAGTTQSDATAISARVNIIASGAAATGVKLVYDARPHRIVNRTGNDIKVWPQTSGNIEGQGANIHIPLPNGSTVDLFPTSSTTWIAT